MLIFNPANFDPKSLVPEPLVVPARILVGQLMSRVMKGAAGDGEYVPLQAAYLQAMVGRTHLGPVRAALIAARVIECDNWYQKGEKSFGYRLLPPFDSAPVERVAVTDRHHLARLRANRVRVQPALTHPVHRRLMHWLGAVGIDAGAAREAIDRRLSSPTKRLQHMLAVEAIAAKEWWLNWDERGRVYHNVVNLPRECRRHLTLAGRPVVLIDIANAQPLLFGAMAVEKLGLCCGKEISEDACNSQVTQLFLNVSPSPRYPSYDRRAAESPTNYRQNDEATPDVLSYLDLCQTGRFYEHVMALLGYDGDRHAFKTHFFAKVFFSRDRDTREAGCTAGRLEASEADFPAVWGRSVGSDQRMRSNPRRPCSPPTAGWRRQTSG